jgi:hypothetical protein
MFLNCITDAKDEADQNDGQISSNYELRVLLFQLFVLSFKKIWIPALSFRKLKFSDSELNLAILELQFAPLFILA